MEQNGSMDVPDADAIKMFVGQIPKGWNENEVRAHFEEYGRIYLINVLRDKMTKQSRGCCFITYYARKAALEAQNACHNLRTLPGMNHPIQMKPADNENRHERKIFVGMITKKLTESDLRMLFSRFGLIEECSILRDTNGISRGCGFVTFSSKACALSAIKGMHQSTIMEGCSAPLVVKMADTQKDKSSTAAVTAAATAAAAEQLFCQKTPYLTQLLQLLQQQVAANTALANANFNSAPQTNFANSLNSLSAVQPGTNDLTALTLLATLSAANSCMQPNSIGSTSNNATSSYSSLTGYLPGPSGSSPTSTNNSFSLGNFLQNVNTPTNASGAALLNTATAGSQSSSAGVSNQTQTEGPEGSNLFIYHLPQDFVDTDLAQTFIPFGNVLSAKVFIDKTTNLSKCFGFVSFDNPLSAHVAIQAMNGFQVGPKRLKVQLKRSKDKPYWYDMS